MNKVIEIARSRSAEKAEYIEASKALAHARKQFWASAYGSRLAEAYARAVYPHKTRANGVNMSIQAIDRCVLETGDELIGLQAPEGAVTNGGAE